MEKLHFKPYKIAMVALDLTAMDDNMIRYAALVSKVLPLERILFVHVAKKLELPEDLLKKYPDLMAPLDESIERELATKIHQYFDPSTIDIQCIIREGHPINKILKLAKVKRVDLILMGRKKNLQGSGLISSHIARRCPCSLLLVTEDFKPEIQRILVPVDFSGHSRLAVKHAHSLSEETGAELGLMHIYSVPVGFSKTGKTHREFAEIMKRHAENDGRRFLSSHALPEITCEYLLADDGRHASQIYDYAKEQDANLIVLGSKGRTRASAILMGSLAERLMVQDCDIPMLIVKNKGENMTFLEAVMKI